MEKITKESKERMEKELNLKRQTKKTKKMRLKKEM